MNTPLENFRALWASYLVLPDESIKKDILTAMESLQEESGLSESEWEEFTLTLPGFDVWWKRVRLEFLDQVKQFLNADE